MKHLLLTVLILFMAMPVFAVPGEYTTLANGTKICDDSESQAYFIQLEKQFFEKHQNGSFTGKDYNREVLSPLLFLEEEQQLKGYCGFKDL